MAIVIDASSPALPQCPGPHYSFQAGDLLLRNAGAGTLPELTWTVVGPLEFSWAYATRAGSCPASDLAFPPLRPGSNDSTGVPWRPVQQP